MTLRPVLSPALAMAACIDAGNRFMRKAGRVRWNAEDLAAGLAEANRLAPLVPGWSVDRPLDCTKKGN